MLGCKPNDALIEVENKYENLVEMMDKKRHQRLVGKLIFVFHIRPDIALLANVVSQYMHFLKD